ncbi:hypothetical protein [Alloprevotella tannerae]|uniref:hypothetical protein n=1 Tax=Alloprevotella tannerae TaxID=76122 RepID=UPI00288C540B|nr:hypothetical protein [Alloprevotella tannerae]
MHIKSAFGLVVCWSHYRLVAANHRLARAYYRLVPENDRLLPPNNESAVFGLIKVDARPTKTRHRPPALHLGDR